MKDQILKRLQDEIGLLERELHSDLPKEIRRARELGDLRENAEYHAAKERQSFVHARIAMLQTPDGSGRLELFEYLDDLAIETQPTLPNEIGMHRVAFSVDDIDEALAIAARHGCHPLRGVAEYRDVYKLTYLRGPSGIIVMLAQELKGNAS